MKCVLTRLITFAMHGATTMFLPLSRPNGPVSVDEKTHGIGWPGVSHLTHLPKFRLGNSLPYCCCFCILPIHLILDTCLSTIYMVYIWFAYQASWYCVQTGAILSVLQIYFLSHWISYSWAYFITIHHLFTYILVWLYCIYCAASSGYLCGIFCGLFAPTPGHWWYGLYTVHRSHANFGF